MRPILFQIGSIQISSFFFMIMVATLGSTFYIYQIAKRRGLRLDVVLDMGIIGMITGVLGTRIFHILVEAPDYYWQYPIRVFHFWRGGFVSFGAIIAIPISLWIYFRKRKIEQPWQYYDLIAISTPIIILCIRIACLLAGCCYGKPTDLPWAITFTHPGANAFHYYPNIPLHPVQVYNMINAVILFTVINWFYFKKRKFHGQTGALFIMMYAVLRASTEYFRGDIDRGVYFGGVISTGQVVGILGFALGVYLYRRFSKDESKQLSLKAP